MGRGAGDRYGFGGQPRKHNPSYRLTSDALLYRVEAVYEDLVNQVDRELLDEILVDIGAADNWSDLKNQDFPGDLGQLVDHIAEIEKVSGKSFVLEEATLAQLVALQSIRPLDQLDLSRNWQRYFDKLYLKYLGHNPDVLVQLFQDHEGISEYDFQVVRYLQDNLEPAESMDLRIFSEARMDILRRIAKREREVVLDPKGGIGIDPDDYERMIEFTTLFADHPTSPMYGMREPAYLFAELYVTGRAQDMFAAFRTDDPKLTLIEYPAGPMKIDQAEAQFNKTLNQEIREITHDLLETYRNPAANIDGPKRFRKIPAPKPPTKGAPKRRGTGWLDPINRNDGPFKTRPQG